MTEAEPTPEPVYTEPGRGYGSVYLFAALIAAGFVFDVILGGGLDHLPGWIVAFALVIGVDLLVVYAARATHSITVTEAELRVGDDAIDRADIVGLDRMTDRSLPALGWPLGLPRGAKGVTLQLVDDRELAVATRFPARLEAALGVGGAGEKERPEVRVADPDDLLVLDDIDERAEVIFRVAGYDLPRLMVAPGARDDAKAIFVVGRPVVGYVCVDEVDGDAHVVELAVLPSVMKQGFGSELLEHACRWAADHDYPAVTLTTYADVAWNGPFYRRRGFDDVPDPSPALQAIRTEEAGLGLDDVGPRVVMRRELR